MVDVAQGDLSTVSRGSFAIGDILGTSLLIFRRNFHTFGMLAAIFLFPDLIVSLAAPDVAFPSATRHGAFLTSWSLVASMLEALAQVPIVLATFAYVNSDPVRAIAAMRESKGLYASALLVAIVQGIGVVAGFIFFILPGLMLATLWYVAFSVRVIERSGVIASLKRSAALTKGHRWSVLGIVLITVFGSALAEVAVGQVAHRLWGLVTVAFANFLVRIVVLPLGTIVGAITYRTLRLVKEGPGIEMISEVFA